MDLLGIDHAVDTINATTLPELVKALDAFLARFERLVDRLNGTSLVLIVPPAKD